MRRAMRIRRATLGFTIAGSVLTLGTTPAAAGVLYQPDAHIKVPGVDPMFSGDNLYDTNNLDGTIPQQLREQTIAQGQTAVFKMRVENDGTETDRLAVRGIAGTSDWKVRYFRGSKNITGKVTGNGYRPLLEPAARRVIRLEVTADPGGLGFDIVLFVRSRRDGAPGLDDHIRAETNGS
jgi:hypothetical protein